MDNSRHGEETAENVSLLENENVITPSEAVNDNVTASFGTETTPDNSPQDAIDAEEGEYVDIPLSSFDMDDELQHKHTPAVKKSKKRTLGFLVFILANVIVIAITAFAEFGRKNHDYSTLGDLAKSISNYWYYLLCALACFLAVYLFQSLKMYRMIRVTHGKFKFRIVLKSVILGKYYDYITPLAIGGQPFQAYYLTKNKIPAGTATAVPIAQLFLGMFGFLTLSIVSVLFFGNRIESTVIKVFAYIGISFNLIIPFTLLLFSLLPNVTTKIVSFFIKLLGKMHIVKHPDETVHKAIATINEYRSSVIFIGRSKGTMILGYVLSVLEKLAEMSVTFFVILACNGGTGNYIDITVMTVFIHTATSFIPTPGNAGAAEGSFYIVFGSFWPMFIWRLFSYYAYLIVGIVVIILNGFKRAHMHKTK
ncbi:MAG: flippase-like domain-containing protein [Clostridia bacterium]|nr:flippase-like domain-containing protein [Clostridia bacterium]